MKNLATFIVSLLPIVAALLGMLGALGTVLGAGGIAIAHISDDAPMQANATRYLVGGICFLALYAMLRTPAFAGVMAELIAG